MKNQFTAKKCSNYATEFNKKHNKDLRNAHWLLGNEGKCYTTLA